MSFIKRVVLILGLICTYPALAELKIDISGAVSEPIPVAVPYFNGDFRQS